MTDDLPTAPALARFLRRVIDTNPGFDSYTSIPIRIGTWDTQVSPREIRRTLDVIDPPVMSPRGHKTAR